MGALKLCKDVSKPGLLLLVRGVFEGVVEEVCGRKFSTGDCLMSGLAVFLEKHASLLQFDLTRHTGTKVVEMNLRRLYGLAQVPCDTTLRRRLDPISPVRYRRAFQQVLQRAQRGKALQRMSAWRGHYLVAVDGTGTFSSQRVHGSCCLRARHRNGSITYSHQQLCAVMVHPDQRQVLPMAIEAVCNGDGSTKNDCERGAWARLVPVLASLYPAHEVDRDCRWAVLAGSPDPAAAGAWTALSAGGSGGRPSASAGSAGIVPMRPGLQIPRPKGRSGIASCAWSRRWN